MILFTSCHMIFTLIIMIFLATFSKANCPEFTEHDDCAIIFENSICDGELTKISNEFLYSQFAEVFWEDKNIGSVLVRDNCTLIIYEEQSFWGAGRVFPGSKPPYNVEGKIIGGSVGCMCKSTIKT